MGTKAFVDDAVRTPPGRGKKGSLPGDPAKGQAAKRAPAERTPHPTGTTAVLRSYNPADGSLVGTFPTHSAAHVRDVVDRARAASAWWRAQGFAGRQKHLRAWRTYIWRHCDEIADLIPRERQARRRRHPRAGTER